MGTSAAFVAHTCSVPLSLILPSLLLLVSPDSCRGGRDLLLAVAAIANRTTLPACTVYPKRSRRASQWRDGRRSRRDMTARSRSVIVDEQILAGRLAAASQWPRFAGCCFAFICLLLHSSCILRVESYLVLGSSSTPPSKREERHNLLAV